jgi:hypothetical protein
MNAIEIARALGLEDCEPGCTCHGSEEERVDVAVHESFDPDPRFHEDCGYLWSLHDNSDPLNKGPFGCPSELAARLRWGDDR